MRIYLSGSFVSQHRLRGMADELWHLGHELTSTWLQETAMPEVMDRATFYKQLGIKDLTEVKAADCIIMDTFDASSTGGRYCEWGYALGQQKLHYIVGPVNGVFDLLADRTFKDWGELLSFFKETHTAGKYEVTTLQGTPVLQVG